jgi:hypothetical protein
VDLLEILLVPQVIVGCLVGLLAAAAVHKLGMDPEPVLLEAGLVAAGFLIGLVFTGKRAKSAPPESSSSHHEDSPS